VLTIQSTNNLRSSGSMTTRIASTTAIYAGEVISSQAIQIACAIRVPNGKVDSGRDPTKHPPPR
jgi:hypothetical protein